MSGRDRHDTFSFRGTAGAYALRDAGPPDAGRALFSRYHKNGFRILCRDGLGSALFICAVSTIKFRMKGFDLHVYDLFFTGSDGAAFRFLLEEYAYLIVPVVVAALLAIVFVTTVAVVETRLPIRRRWGVLALLAGILVLPVSYPLDAAKPRYFHYLGGFNASAFFISLLDVQYLALETPLAGRLRVMPPQRPFADTVDCKPTSESPDVFVVLSESQTNPGYFPQLKTAASVVESYRSQDGKSRELFVETFGGGTWVSNLSVMTGLSSVDFGAQSPYLTMFLENRIGGSIPEVLARCGYRTVAILPMKHSFVNEGPFLESIGFETVLDYDAIGASQYAHRDQFYFDAAERLVEEHRKSDGRPLFLAIQTMFPHSPYTEQLSRDIDAAGYEPAPEPELNEYLRRMLISRRDFHAFLGQRKQAPSARGSVILEYGDHQSFATKHLADELSGPQSLTDLRSVAYKTYFSLHAFAYEPSAAIPEFAVLDIGYLGVTFLQWARLSTSPMLEALLDVRDQCEGRFHLCPERTFVDEHLRRRVDSRQLQIF
jgi:hypothetical protein